MKQTFNQLHNQAKQQNLRTEKADKKEKEEVEADKKRSPSIPRNRRFGLGYGDRKKSVSKSIQRQHSMSSLVDYTLKFLNDDMAINASKFIQEPLIEKSVEEDFGENQSLINKMIF